MTAISSRVCAKLTDWGSYQYHDYPYLSGYLTARVCKRCYQTETEKTIRVGRDALTRAEAR